MTRKLLNKLWIVLFLAGCASGYNTQVPDNGQVVGVSSTATRNFTKPLGMVYVPSGFYHLGQSDQDMNFNIQNVNRTVSVHGFWMDATAITNNQYRQFVNWVRDSLYAVALGYIKVSSSGDTAVDWKKMRSINYGDKTILDKLSNYTLPEQDRIDPNKVELDPYALIYKLQYFDLEAAARSRDKNRNNYAINYNVPVYPDTLSWVRDFSYSYNEPIAIRYFSHPSYGNYPVVGVNWKQAVAFSNWRTQYLNSYLSKRGYTTEYPGFRLPTESEWEFAARGGRNESMYPWGGPYLRNKRGCLLANFKPGRGNYAEDGGLYTVRVDSYWPNDYGLYNMAGNVDQWTSSYYYESANLFESDLNPDVRYDAKDSDPPRMKRKVIKGGSWKDVGYYLQCGVRQFEYQDSSKPYIGFRDVLDLAPNSRL